MRAEWATFFTPFLIYLLKSSWKDMKLLLYNSQRLLISLYSYWIALHLTASGASKIFLTPFLICLLKGSLETWNYTMVTERLLLFHCILYTIWWLLWLKHFNVVRILCWLDCQNCTYCTTLLLLLLPLLLFMVSAAKSVSVFFAFNCNDLNGQWKSTQNSYCRTIEQ
jgi:hypothetical protein